METPGFRILAATCFLFLTAIPVFGPPLLGATAPRRESAAQAWRPTFFGAMQVNEPDHDRWANAVAAAGLDTVQVTLYARHQRWDEATMYWEREAPWVVSEIRAARRAGLRVMLVMRVALEHGLAENRHLWHGMIWPRDQELAEWMRNYREFVLWGAQIAANEDVDLFVLGNELSSLTSTTPVRELPALYEYYLDPARVASVRARLVKCAQEVQAGGRGDDLVQLDGGRYADLESMLRAEELARRTWTRTVMAGDERGLATLNARRARYDSYWRRLAAAVRAAHDGPLSYGANFDQFEEVGFWDELDYVGVNAYFPLSRYGQSSAARIETMEEAWRRVGTRIAAVAGSTPTVFVELGWTRRHGSTVRPYSYDRVEVLETAGEAPLGASPTLSCVHWASQPEDARERVGAVQALLNVVRRGEFVPLHGFTLWKATTREEHRAIEPFAAVLGRPLPYPLAEWPRIEASDIDGLDAAFVALAAEIAREVRAH